MATLTYRGTAYLQQKGVKEKQFVELTYRKNVYSNRREEVSSNHSQLSYRGISYQK